MPFRSQAQRKFFYAKMQRGEIPRETVKRWEEHTPKGKLPEKVSTLGDWTEIGPDTPHALGPPLRIKKYSDFDGPEFGDPTKLMPRLRQIHKIGHLKLAEPPPPKGVSLEEWDKILQYGVNHKKGKPIKKQAYKLQGRTNIQGLNIAIENRKGSVRKGVDRDKHEWRIKMKHPYGYIKGTNGADGEPVDAYVGPDKSAPDAYVVHQHKCDGKGYDEDKVMLGFKNKKEAKEAYLKHYDDPKFLGPISKVSVERLKRLVASKRKLVKISSIPYTTPSLHLSTRAVFEHLKQKG